MIFIRKHGHQIAEHMRRRRKAVQEQNGRSIAGTGFAIEDFQPVHFERAIENGGCNDQFHINCLLDNLSLWWTCCREGKPSLSNAGGAMSNSASCPRRG